MSEPAGTVPVFISWSKERSRAMALALAAWLPDVVQSARCWMSDISIEAGALWPQQIVEALQQHRVGVICVTPENQGEPFLQFEAGAITNSAGAARVCPLVFGMRLSDLRPPLQMLQAVAADEAGVWKLIQMINRQAGATALSEERLRRVFSRSWSELARQLADIEQLQHEPLPKPSTDERLDEVRDLLHRVLAASTTSARIALLAEPSAIAEVLSPPVSRDYPSRLVIGHVLRGQHAPADSIDPITALARAAVSSLQADRDADGEGGAESS